jgi:hypothetical protein
MHCLQSVLVDMGVNLSRGDVGVTEHFLDDPQIGSVSEEMRCK